MTWRVDAEGRPPQGDGLVEVIAEAMGGYRFQKANPVRGNEPVRAVPIALGEYVREMCRDEAAHVATAVRAHLAATLAEAGEDVARAMHTTDWRVDPDGDLAADLAAAALSVIAARLGIEGEA